ncbi:NLI interacting factor-like phosphatase (macronuclear) [Tetrahymena thermophila SB210]|uniref:protein-serine/threonine phosphatase n=1 Tax=Tetrahymena thermophila (strain SB210) TaxID=312017 RepID=Q22Y09_TETTS|nr:NLI interacting factor-like phosphatase [Tetrahymena thermophila SB210]EAR90215.1 NLI interacting factor-like phosphatase [Tetrahymena thermophila SB210]|eukprot:XP_001010460.1 NLI interacting factor-like phosphatase [Tetrahymena thermophila SB210]
MAHQVDKVKKKIQKDNDKEASPKKGKLTHVQKSAYQQNKSKGRKISVKIERGDKIVIGNHSQQKVIDFVLLDRKEIKQKKEEEEQTKQIEAELTKKKYKLNDKKKSSSNIKKPYNKNKEKLITIIDDDETYSQELIEIEDEEDNTNGHLEKQDEEDILKQNKKIFKKVNPFLCQELGSASKDPRQNKLVSEIQNILQQNPSQKLNLILDLDETLVNTVWVTNENQSKLEEIYRYKMPSNKNVITIQYSNNEGAQKEFITILRPHLKEFVTEMKKYFNILVYSHGRKDYVLKLLDKIDPRRDLFNRNNIFKNEGQVNIKTQKDIKNIIECDSPSALEKALKSSIIIDDIFEIWLEETFPNVVPIKRFQPLNEFLQKNNQCTIFMNHNKQFLRFPKTRQDYFQDVDFECSNQFLKGLQRYLTSTAIQFYNKKLIKNDQNADVREYLTFQKLMIMNQLDLNLTLIEYDELYDVFRYVALAMGANITLKNFRYAIVNKDFTQQYAKKMALLKEQNPNLTFIDVQWLVDSFFLHYQLDIQNYVIE